MNFNVVCNDYFNSYMTSVNIVTRDARKVRLFIMLYDKDISY